MAERKDIESKRQTCWDKALTAHGTACIFQRRAGRLRGIRRLITFLGIAVPVLVGFIATRIYTAGSVPSGILLAAAVLSLVQLLISIWGVVAKWEDTYSDAVRAAQKNLDLQQQWEVLAKERADLMEEEFDRLLDKDRRQSESDTRQHITDREKRFGMRSGLLRYQRECAVCKQVPKFRSTRGIKCDGNCLASLPHLPVRSA